MSWDWPKRDVKPFPPEKKNYEDLGLGSNTVVVRGPAEAVFLARLWDLMLCQADRRRLHKANSRGTNWTPPYSRPGDNLIRGLFKNTEEVLSPHLFVRLWAPLADAPSGELRTDLCDELNLVTRKLGIRVPLAANELWNMQMNRERLRFTRPERRGFPLREVGAMPGLRVEWPALPVTELRDPQGRLHCPHGPAVVHGDGTPEFYWRGTRVPSYFIPITERWLEQYPKPELIPLTRTYRELSSDEALQFPNTEIRRAACEIVGWHKILEDLRAVVLDKDPDPTVGELLLVNLPVPENFDSIPQLFLRVQCGTGRTFALAVPDTCRTALEANAWTYGLSPEDYRPEVRT